MKKIFYSWQSDVPKNRSFLEKCIEKAVSNVGGFEIDSATRGAMGAPRIDDDIQKRIDHADLIVAEVSIINPELGDRRCPNPNVMLEVGYALKSLGEEKVILVADSITTPNTNELPFDIRNRRLSIFGRFDSENKETIVGKLSGILIAYRSYSSEVPAPYIYLAAGSISSNGNVELKLYNTETQAYFIEILEIAGGVVHLNKSLIPNESFQVTFTLPDYPFSHNFDELSFIVSRGDLRFRIFQKVTLGGRADGKYNLSLVEERPSRFERL